VEELRERGARAQRLVRVELAAPAAEDWATPEPWTVARERALRTSPPAANPRDPRGPRPAGTATSARWGAGR